jgi:putrescine transport system permease protein
MTRRSPFVLGLLGFGYAFLYLPIALLVAWSFNDSRLVSVWGGFSTRWYAHLAHDGRFLEAAWLSLQVAAASATLALILGTAAALALARLGRFRSRSLFEGLIAAPLVMPDVIMGLALLLMFVALEQAIGWPEGRGFLTITLAHATIALCYVTVVVRARLAQMDPSLEEAAQDLGAPPAKAFLLVTLPLLSPALAAGWLLAFTLSLDDVVVAQFVSGPGATTLPIQVMSSVRLGVSPEINALGTLIVAVVGAGIIIAWRLMERRGEG